jgi:hypothetical protein
VKDGTQTFHHQLLSGQWLRDETASIGLSADATATPQLTPQGSDRPPDCDRCAGAGVKSPMANDDLSARYEPNNDANKVIDSTARPVHVSYRDGN